MKYTTDDLKTMIQWPLQKKVQTAQTRILEWCRHYDNNVFVAFSGGKNSCVLLDLCRRVMPCIKAVFSNDGIHYDIAEFAKSVENVTILEPSKDKTCLRQANSDAVIEWGKATGYYPIVGTTIEGSAKRKRLWLETGCNAFDEGTSQPLGYWTKNDILQYLYEFEIPYPVKAFGVIKEYKQGKFKFVEEK